MSGLVTYNQMDKGFVSGMQHYCKFSLQGHTTVHLSIFFMDREAERY